MTDPNVAALQTVLAGEHAALWVYGVIGGQTSASGSPELYAQIQAAYQAHRARRDQVTTVISATGTAPIAAEVGYQVGDVSTEARAWRAALALEHRATAVYVAAVGETTGTAREIATAALLDSAIRQLRFRGSPESFPGLTAAT